MYRWVHQNRVAPLDQLDLYVDVAVTAAAIDAVVFAAVAVAAAAAVVVVVERLAGLVVADSQLVV